MALRSPVPQLLPIVTDEGQPIKGSRVADAASAVSIYTAIRLRNQAYMLNQTKVQMGLDGMPPYDPAKLRATQQAGIANINTGRLKAIVEEASLPILDQINGVQTFINLAYNTDGDEDLSDQAATVEEEHFALLSRSRWFNYEKQRLVLQLAAHGVVVTYFPDPYCWEWKSEPLGQFMIPMQTEANEDSVEVACMVRSMNPSSLIGYLDSPDPNWNKEAIRKALMAASPDQPRYDDYAAYEAKWKANDIYYNSVLPKIRVVHMWVRESDDAVSYFIFPESGAQQEYLYKGIRRYQSQREAFQIFSFDVGTDGYYHSIRGVAFKALTLVTEINRVLSSFLDGLRLSSKLVLKPTNEDALQNLNFMEHGAFLVLPPELEAQTSVFPNFAQSLLPGMNILNGLIAQNLPGVPAQQQAEMSGDARKTKAEIMQNVQQLAYFGQGQSEIFMQKWESLMIEQLRRILRKDYKKEEKGGEEIAEFRRRCKERGVTDEFWDKIDLSRTTAERALGAGSAQQQFFAMQTMQEYMDRGYYDEQGKLNIIKESTRLVAGREKANSYCGNQKAQRPVQDTKNAEFENKFMAQGIACQVYDNDNNSAHAAAHIGGNSEIPTESLFDDAGALDEAVQYGDDDAVLRIVPAMQMKLEHTAVHVERMADGPQAAQYRQILQQIGGTLENAQKKASKIMKERDQAQQQAMEEEGAMAQEQQQNYAHDSYNLTRDLAKTRIEIAAMQQKQNLTLEFQAREGQQKLRQRDLEAAQELSFNLAKKALEPKPTNGAQKTA